MRKIKGLKKIIYVAMCAVLLTGCSKKDVSVEENNNGIIYDAEVCTTEGNNEESIVADEEENIELSEAIIINDGRESYRYTFNPYAIPDIYKETYGEEFVEYYKGFCDAVLAGEDSFECPDYDTYWKILDVAYIYLPITSDCLDMPVYDDNTIIDGKCQIVYRYSKEELLENIEEFNSKVESIITTYLQDGDTEFERALKLYRYCSMTHAYDYVLLETGVVTGDKLCGGYRMIMDELGICQEYSAAYAYLLLQVGIDADVVGGGNDDTAHAWNIVRIDNQYYYMDTTSQSGYTSYPLYFFGMTIDDYAQLSGFPAESHIVGGTSMIKVNYNDVSDDRFEELRKCHFYEIDHDNHTIKYEGYIYEEIDYESEDNGEFFEGELEF